MLPVTQGAATTAVAAAQRLPLTESAPPDTAPGDGTGTVGCTAAGSESDPGPTVTLVRVGRPQRACGRGSPRPIPAAQLAVLASECLLRLAVAAPLHPSYYHTCPRGAGRSGRALSRKRAATSVPGRPSWTHGCGLPMPWRGIVGIRRILSLRCSDRETKCA